MKTGKPINNQKPQQQVNMTPLEIAVLPWEKCYICGNTTFLEAKRCKVMGAMHPKNTLRQPAKIWFNVWVCAICKQEMGVKKGKENDA